MRPNFEDFIGSNPCLYGRQLLKDLGTKDYYVDEYDAVGFFGYEVEKYNPENFSESSVYIGDLFDDKLVALKIADKNKIYLAPKLTRKRERLTLFHEAGHETIPWHPHYSHKVSQKDIDPIIQNQIERQAFFAGAEILFPLKHFLDDLSGVNLSFQSISGLGDRYNSSFEATGIHFARMNRNSMAIVVVKKNDPTKEKIITCTPRSNGQLALPFPVMPSYEKIIPASTAPLRVQYCTHSYKFPRFIKSGTEIDKGNIIYDCWKNEEPTQGEIPASVFGSSQKFKYNAQCIFYYDRVFALLSLPNRYYTELF